MMTRVLNHSGVADDKAVLVFVRGYYLDSMGQPGVDDANIYDDAVFLVSPSMLESWNANTGPSFPHKGAAKLNLGVYQFYKGLHRGKYKALRPHPEGVVLKCTRNGKPSTCSHTNIHKGGSNAKSFDVVWSLGCLTVPAIQYSEYQTRVYAEMDKFGQKTIDVILIENRADASGRQAFYDERGAEIT